MSRFIVITTTFFLLSGCSVARSDVHIQEPCLKSADTYGDAVECAIKLNELQR